MGRLISNPLSHYYLFEDVISTRCSHFAPELRKDLAHVMLVALLLRDPLQHIGDCPRERLGEAL